jgi:hypothetical protein
MARYYAARRYKARLYYRAEKALSFVCVLQGANLMTMDIRRNDMVVIRTNLWISLSARLGKSCPCA